MSSRSGLMNDKFFIQCQAGMVYINPIVIPTSADEIHINGNPITTILDKTFALKRCRKLSLGYNQLQFLGPLAFQDMFFLESLLLNDNLIAELPNEVFEMINVQHQRLTHLYLQNNRLASLSSGLFSKVTTIRYLNLQGNPLMVIGEELTLELEPIDTVLISIPEGTLYNFTISIK